jgi:hypothetical protein
MHSCDSGSLASANMTSVSEKSAYIFSDRDPLKELLGLEYRAALPAQARCPDLAQYEEAQQAPSPSSG